MPLKQLILREIKAILRNPAFIASLLLIFVFYGFIGSITRAGISQTIQETTKLNIGVVAEENNQFVNLVVKNFNVSLAGGVKLYSDLGYALDKSPYVIVIPKGFTENATSGLPIVVLGYTKIEDLSQISLQAKIGVLQLVSSILSKVITQVISILYNYSLPQERYVVLNSSVIVFGKAMSIQQINNFVQLVTALILILSFMMGLTTSSAASLTAIEKVEKAFEMLLSQPVPRREIVLAKIAGSAVMAFLTGLIYYLALFFMISQISQPVGKSQNMLAIPLNLDFITPDFVVYVIASLVIGLIYSGAIGVLIGSISSDERTAGILATPITFIYIGFGIASLFISMPLNIMTSIIYGILVAPTVYVLAMTRLSPKMVMLAFSSFASSIIICVIIIGIAVKVFNSDIVITGVRMGFRRKERKAY